MLRKTWLPALVTLAVTASGLTAAPARAVAADEPKTITVQAADDTYVSETSPAADHAAFTWMSAFNGPGNERFGLVRFKVAGIPEGAEVKATLELHSVRTTDTALAVRPTTSAWDEHVLYTNRPTLGATVATHTGFTAGEQAKIDLSEAVAGDGAYAFALTSTGGAQGVFHSSRATATGAVPPRLVITYTAAGQPPVPAGPLPFNLPAISTLRASGKKVFAHYFTPYPISLDNQAGSSDYYARNYLTPTGEGGKHAAYGGLLRDRPLPRAAMGGNWQLADMEAEIRLARAAGLDGFTVDILSLTSQHWSRTKLLIEAAKNVDPGFKIVLMPDMNGLKGVTPAQLAASMAELAQKPGVYRLADKRLVVSPFKAENQTVSWWREFMDTMQAKHGVKVAFVPVFLNAATHAKAFAPISYGFSNWGNRSPAQQSGIGANIDLAHGMGKIWMQPVSVQDERPNQGVYDEANNTENLRVTWDKAISGGADWVQLTTWNDFSEGTQFTPSAHNGGAYLDITSYYLTKFKTGKTPTIVRDTVYLTHRLQKASQRPGGGPQTKFMTLRGGSSPARDTVEVLAFLTGAATIQAGIGGTAKKAEAAAGVTATTFPLAYGRQSASVVRAGKTTAKVVSPFEVRTSLPNQDLQYVAATSGRP
ncbi:endo-1,3-alpha-glucanase family glycosylhydrolase [Nonomuraea typhae]|uniref:endo-1,3-alpha-glucanase family glycosylhydrolase n=1 Tax=Nonomuraea typhae TaxID=2603600 RepID=UPI001CA52B7A|nr:endo-1,3-alpha-glucanase family glycosylhydrolase [Nonomuraea typhae]